MRNLDTLRAIADSVHGIIETGCDLSYNDHADPSLDRYIEYMRPEQNNEACDRFTLVFV